MSTQSTESAVPAEMPDQTSSRNALKRVGKGIAILLLVPLVVVVLLELNTLRLQQQTEQKRREIAMAGGKVTIEKRVPSWLSAIAGDDAHTFLDQPAIVSISMTRDEIGDEQVAVLNELPHLQTLNLEDSRVTSRGLESIARLTSLRELNLLNTKVTDLAPLTKLPNLEILKIDFCREIRTEHLSALADIPKLRVLGAGGLRLTDPGVAAIGECTGLEWLDIKGSNLSDTGLQPLQNLKHLKQLTLTYSTFAPADLDALRKALPDCQIAL